MKIITDTTRIEDIFRRDNDSICVPVQKRSYQREEKQKQYAERLRKLQDPGYCLYKNLFSRN